MFTHATDPFVMAVGRRLTPDLTLPVFVSVSGDGQDSAGMEMYPSHSPSLFTHSPLFPSLLPSLARGDCETERQQPVLTVRAD